MWHMDRGENEREKWTESWRGVVRNRANNIEWQWKQIPSRLPYLHTHRHTRVCTRFIHHVCVCPIHIWIHVWSYQCIWPRACTSMERSEDQWNMWADLCEFVQWPLVSEMRMYKGWKRPFTNSHIYYLLCDTNWIDGLLEMPFFGRPIFNYSYRWKATVDISSWTKCSTLSCLVLWIRKRITALLCHIIQLVSN